MKLQLSKQLFALTMAFMLFSILPTGLDAQSTGVQALPPKPKKCTTHSQCCRLCLCIFGECVYVGGGWLLPGDSELSDSDQADPSVIQYGLESDGVVSIRLYDATGHLIRTLVDKWMPSGDHELVWNEKVDIGNTLHPGMYLLTLQAGDIRETTRVMAIN